LKITNSELRVTSDERRAMHRLTRKVRFSINPFLPTDDDGFNSFSSQPAGDGLALFFELAVTLEGTVEEKSGFVVNVLDIDKEVRKFVVPVFAERIKKYFGKGVHIGFSQIAQLLAESREKLKVRFANAVISRLSLQLNPLRAVSIDCQENDMVYFSEKFEFAATHKLWNDSLSERENFDLFGKCANPAGHGHNYIVEVTVQARPDDLHIADFQRVVDEKLIRILDHKNLNVDVPHFSKVIPTVENLSVFAWDSLKGQFEKAVLHCITIQETEKTFCSYYGK
jgi:6-pyruvoyltetrahydropterin/6-carboxytetrahydropterin synthase